jgi:hypothetical protein
MDRRWIQVGGAAGIAGIVVALGTFPLLGTSPDSSASVAQMGDYVLRHQRPLTAVGVMVVVSAVLFAWFVASYGWWVHQAIPDAPLGLLTVVTGTAVAGLIVLDGFLDVAMVFLSHQSSTSAHSPAMTDLYQLENGIVMPGAVGLVGAAFLASVAVAAWRAVAGTRRWAYVWAALAMLSAAGGVIALCTVNGGMSSPLSYAPLFGVSLATVVIGVVMVRGKGRVAAADRARAGVPVHV